MCRCMRDLPDMMLCQFLIFFASPGVPFEVNLTFKGSGIYERIFTTTACVSDSGRVFILDRQGKTIRQYSNDGILLPNIGRAGQGPGEFHFPLQIYLFEKNLYVNDRMQAKQFDENGRFVNAFHFPTGVIRLTKVDGGWVGLRGLLPRDRNNPMQLVWFNESLDQERVLATWPSEAERNPDSPSSHDPFLDQFNPVEDFTDIMVDRIRETVVVKPSGEQRLYGFDLASFSQKFDLEIPGKKIPFDKINGQRIVNDYAKRSSASDTQIKVEALLPDYFPVIKSVVTTPFNQVRVVKWENDDLHPTRHSETRAETHLYFNFEGKKVIKHEDNLDYSRVVKVIGSHVYLICYLSDSEEWSVAKVPMATAGDFIKANPLPGFDEL